MVHENDWDLVVQRATQWRTAPALRPRLTDRSRRDLGDRLVVARHRARAELEGCLLTLRELEAAEMPPPERKAALDVLQRRLRAAEAAYSTAVLTGLLVSTTGLDALSQRAVLAERVREAIERDGDRRTELSTQMARQLAAARSERDRRAVLVAIEAALRTSLDEVEAARAAMQLAGDRDGGGQPGSGPRVSSGPPRR